jgi:hypothetical protein
MHGVRCTHYFMIDAPLPDEDAQLRVHLAALGPATLGELQRVLQAPASYRAEILGALIARPAYSDLASLIAMADTDETVRLRLLRAIRDIRS